MSCRRYGGAGGCRKVIQPGSERKLVSSSSLSGRLLLVLLSTLQTSQRSNFPARLSSRHSTENVSNFGSTAFSPFVKKPLKISIEPLELDVSRAPGRGSESLRDPQDLACAAHMV